MVQLNSRISFPCIVHTRIPIRLPFSHNPTPVGHSSFTGT